MPIISISLPNKIIGELDELIDKEGFSSRSEIIRHAIRTMISEKKELNNKEIDAIIIVVHKEDKENKIDEIKHKGKDIIKIQVHSQLKHNLCMELFILKGNGKKIEKLEKLFKTIKGIEYSKLIII